MKDENGDNLFDYAARRARAEAAKKSAMEQVEDNANEQWKLFVTQLAVQQLTIKRRITTDDIRDAYLASDITNKPTTHDWRALGPLMLGLSKMGYCHKDKEFIPSIRRSRHNGPMQVWISDIYRGNSNGPDLSPPQPIEPQPVRGGAGDVHAGEDPRREAAGGRSRP